MSFLNYTPDILERNYTLGKHASFQKKNYDMLIEVFKERA
jgi:hypothetical protein